MLCKDMSVCRMPVL
uniref:Uncharacterized protein n=1 Tax=Anguilla anguilla TaxID=7936 RepID=A0A0E9VWD0_ANGAN